MIAQGQLLNRDNNRLLQGILDKQNVTFGQALQNSFQLTRDANNLQASQERDTIRVLDRDRNFRENKFKDRRNFDRKVFTDDRGFGEGVRRFNVQDENADQSRALQGELGRGRLAIAREGLALRGREADGRIKLTDLKLKAFEEDRAEEQSFVKRSDNLSSYESFVSSGGVDGQGVDTSESSYIEEVRVLDQQSTARNFKPISDAQQPGVERGVSFDAGVDAVESLDVARGEANPAVKLQKLMTLSESLSKTNPAQATQIKLEAIEAQQLIPEGNKESVAAATAAYASFQKLPKSLENGQAAYRSFDGLVDLATTANSFEDFVASLNTGGAADRQIPALLKIYEGTRNSTSRDLVRAQNSDDQRGSIFSGIEDRFKR
tara:strand:- start:138 stop:1268 length:1131 start_codon:yes stop_codon:yes gene_type:complete